MRMGNAANMVRRFGIKVPESAILEAIYGWFR
jgi:hypothetical protein